MAKVKPAAWSAADGSAAVRAKARAWPRTPPVGPETPAVGATLFTVRVKVVVAVRPPASVAVMVTVAGPAGPSGGGYDQLHVPVASSLVSVPSEAVRVTVPLPSGSEKVPVLAAGEPSLTLTAAWSLATVDASLTLVTVTVRTFSVNRPPASVLRTRTE